MLPMQKVETWAEACEKALAQRIRVRISVGWDLREPDCRTLKLRGAFGQFPGAGRDHHHWRSVAQTLEARLADGHRF
jgi:hypothetical protein